MDNSNPLLPHFERIHVRIVALWGSKDCREYRNTLLTDTRNGTRSGFPPHIAKELFRLLHNHDIEYPQFANVTDIVVPFTCVRRQHRVDQPGLDLSKILRAIVLCGLVALAFGHYLR